MWRHLRQRTEERNDVATLEAAYRRGLGPADISQVRIASADGSKVPDFAIPDFKHASAPLRLTFGRKGASGRVVSAGAAAVFTTRPQVKNNVCIACGKCAAVCPAHAITMAPKRDEGAENLARPCFIEDAGGRTPPQLNGKLPFVRRVALGKERRENHPVMPASPLVRRTKNSRPETFRPAATRLLAQSTCARHALFHYCYLISICFGASFAGITSFFGRITVRTPSL